MSIPLFWLAILGLCGLFTIWGDHCQAKDRERMQREARERHMRFLASPEGRAMRRRVTESVRQSKRPPERGVLIADDESGFS